MFLKTGNNNNNKANNNLSPKKVISFLIVGGEGKHFQMQAYINWSQIPLFPYQITSFMLILLPIMMIKLYRCHRLPPIKSNEIK